MFVPFRRFGLLALTVTAALTGGLAQSADAIPDPRQTWQLLDYLAVDYAGAVQNGEVKSTAEYAEMREFAAMARAQLSSLPDKPERTTLLAAADELSRAIEERRSSTEVSAQAHRLADSLLATYPVPMAPKATPDLSRGRALFESQCSTCHGLRGAADGPAAKALDPPPVAFTDRERASQRSAFGYYQVISQGVSGTSMASFSSLSEEDRWALAFYAGTLAYAPSLVAEGERVWRSHPDARLELGTLEAVARTSEMALEPKLGKADAGALMAFIRSQPGKIRSDGPASFALARQRLTASVNSYAAGNTEEAQRLALSAYLDGVEPLEPMLAAASPGLLARLESAMGQYRSSLSTKADAADITRQARDIDGILELSEQALSSSATSRGAAFLGSFTILLREGMEALLIVVAIVVFLRKAGRQELLPYVHGGWLAALLAGAFTWGLATYLVTITGAQREVTEGASSLFAALVLVSVGLWMHRKSMAGRWQQYLTEKLSHALSRRSVWFLAGLAFIAVYREVFETILFYAALWTQGQHGAVVGGLLAGALALAAITYVMLRATTRLPIGQFFAVSSWLVGILAIVLVGKGVAALQEAGLIGFHMVNGPRVDILGIYPSTQTLLAQLVVAAAVIGGFAINHIGSRQMKD